MVDGANFPEDNIARYVRAMTVQEDGDVRYSEQGIYL